MIETGNLADLALAVLAGGGNAKLPGILKKAARLKGPARDRVLAQILLLAGLRKAEGKVEWELRHMGVVIDVTKNSVLMKWRREAIAEGRAEGVAEGMASLLHEQLQTKFGPLPKWVEDRLRKASPGQLERWAKKILTAPSLEGVLGRRL